MKKRGDPTIPRNRTRAVARILSDDFHNHQRCSLRAKIDGSWRTFPVLDWKEEENKTIFIVEPLNESGALERLQFIDDENRLISESDGPMKFDFLSMSYTINFQEPITCGFDTTL